MYIYCIIYIITCISWGCVQHSTAVQPSMALYVLYIYTKVWRATSGRRTPRRAADRRALHYYGWAYMLTLWGNGGYGGSPSVEAGKCVLHARTCKVEKKRRKKVERRQKSKQKGRRRRLGN